MGHASGQQGTIGFIQSMKIISWIVLFVAMAVCLTPSKPPTTTDLIYKAKMKSVSKICDKPRKTKAVKELCRKWEK
jgi:hypothetical protein